MSQPCGMRLALLTGVSCLALAAASGTADAQSTETVQTAPPSPAKSAKADPPAKAAAGPSTSVSELIVTAQKKRENIQTVPIAVTALSQKELTARQIAGGPDLIKEVPNLTFSKTNFTGYNIEIRGIGTQAISVTTDPAVAVAFNDTPFLRNHFFEQEFYDLEDVEVLRGPQGTLFGRNATAGVVDLKSALPVNYYEANLSADFGNYDSRRLEGMLNLPIVDDRLSVRLAGEWTTRGGYDLNTTDNKSVDGRDLWSSRLTIAWKPAPNVQTDFIWEHFSENDDRLRSGKQLCKTDPGPGSIDGVPEVPMPSTYGVRGDYFTQGCLPSVSLYSPQAFEAPLGFTLPYVLGANALGYSNGSNPYDGVTQSPNLRQIESAVAPHYIAKNDTFEVNLNWNVTPDLTFTSQTAYSRDFLWSTEDFNRFGSTPGIWVPNGNLISPSGVFCDPQLGCSNALVAQDLSTERSWQISQEFRLSSNFSGPFNFTVGANYLHYETDEKYYVFSNALTLINFSPVTYPCDNLSCAPILPYGYRYNPQVAGYLPDEGYIDPNPLTSVNDQGHNYYLSENPYVLNSYAVFADANYKLASDLKLDAGVRFTEDLKHFTDIPSWVATEGYGLPVRGDINQHWGQPTGRIVLDWTPKLAFTDQTLFYASYSHGYKAGGANPPGAVFVAETTSNGNVQTNVNPVHPTTFAPEYIEAFEIGTKNTLLDGKLTFNADVFYYNYTGYQVSEIVDRTAINTNYNAHVEGAEIETNWRPLPGLKFNFTGGYENSGLAGGTEAVDLMDRTAGHPDWFVVRPFATEASSCIFPGYVAKLLPGGSPGIGGQVASFCSYAYLLGDDPLTGLPYVPNPTVVSNTFGTYFTPGSYPGFNPATAPNDGAGFSKDLHGNQLPNAPHFTVSLSSEYTFPISQDWAATLHADFYAQSAQWARVFEDPIDRIRGYYTVNFALTLSSSNGWEVMAYVKNAFNVTAITGTFLNSDDTGLTTNVFLTDPRLYGIRVTKHFDANHGLWGSRYSGSDFFTHLFSPRDDGKPPPLWIELGGAFAQLDDSANPFTPPFFSTIAKPLAAPVAFQHAPRASLDYEAKISYQPDGSDWSLSAAVRYGRMARSDHAHGTQYNRTEHIQLSGLTFTNYPPNGRYVDTFVTAAESHEIIDFDVGKDVGLGWLGLKGSSKLSAGVRYVRFDQSSSLNMHADPDYVFHALGPKYEHKYSVSADASRKFIGIGPSLAWEASVPLLEANARKISLDWGVNGAVLFGRQSARVNHSTSGAYSCIPLFNGGCRHGAPATQSGFPAYRSQYQRTVNSNRSRRVAVPNLGAQFAISWRYANAKVSLGYRADEFFGAMDGGIDAHVSKNVGFFGPFANVSIGLGR